MRNQRGGPKGLWRRVQRYQEIGIASGQMPKHLQGTLAHRAAEAEQAWTHKLSDQEFKSYRNKKRKDNWRRKALVALGRGSLPTVDAASQIARSMVANARDRAQVLRLPFSLTLRWAYDKIKAGKCELTGIPFDIWREHAPGEGLRSNFGPSLDRNVPSLGYTQENCRIVIWAYNGAKGSGTDAEVLLMAEALVKRQANLKLDVSRGTCNMTGEGFRDHVNKTWQDHPVRHTHTNPNSVAMS